jgi:translocator protein
MLDLSLIVFFILVAVAASTGVIFKPGAWYGSLNKPAWTPPNIAFPVIWSVLYVMMAVAGWLVWRETGLRDGAIILWAVQLVLNMAWSYLFFGQRRMDLAMADIALLWLAIAGFMVAAWPTSMTAALLFAPYLLWVSIAAALNRAVWSLNPGAGAR